jgi:putative PIN family toxin of toxin-antitoxin system
LFSLPVERVQFYTSVLALDELDRKLALPRLKRYAPSMNGKQQVEAYASQTNIIYPTADIRACRDPDDDHFLSLAVSSNAKWLLTYDEDLLVLDPFVHQGIEVRIVRPEVFLEAMKEI